MSKSSLVYIAAALACGLSAPAFAEDVAKVTWIGGGGATQKKLPTVQNGNDTKPYDLGIVGSSPTIAATEVPFTSAQALSFSRGTALSVNLDVDGSKTFYDFVKFNIPAKSDTKTAGAALYFELEVFNETTIYSSFNSFSAKMFAGDVSSSTAVLESVPLGKIEFDSSALMGDKITDVGSFQNNALAAGNYFWYITGTAVGVTPSYAMQISAVPVPVPEPGTYAMLLAGLAAVGFVAKRRSA